MVLRWSWCFGHPQRPRQAQLWRVQQDPVMFTSKSGTCSFIYYFQVNRHGPCQFLMGVLEHLRRPVSRWNRLNQFVFEKIFINIYHVNFWYTLLALAVLARVELDKVAEGIQEHHDQLETIFYRLSLKNSKKKHVLCQFLMDITGTCCTHNGWAWRGAEGVREYLDLLGSVLIDKSLRNIIKPCAMSNFDEHNLYRLNQFVFKKCL